MVNEVCGVPILCCASPSCNARVKMAMYLSASSCRACMIFCSLAARAMSCSCLAVMSMVS